MCSLFGLIDYKGCLSARDKEKIIGVLATECEVRGTDATGVAYIENGKIKIYKKPLAAHKMKFRFKRNPSVIMGHTRMTTQGSEKFNYNNHPFYSKKVKFALAHNGVIYNDNDLKKDKNLPKTKIETDSYVAVQLIEKKATLNHESIKYMAELVRGSFCFTILNQNNEVYFVKGDNPLVIYNFGGFYIYASTKEILENTINKLRINLLYSNVEVVCGDILKISPDGSIYKSSFDTSNFDYKSMYELYGGMCYKFDSTDFEEEYFKDLVDYAKTIGVTKEDIEYLVKLGYDYFDIEEMLYEPEVLGNLLRGDSSSMAFY